MIRRRRFSADLMQDSDFGISSHSFIFYSANTLSDFPLIVTSFTTATLIPSVNMPEAEVHNSASEVMHLGYCATHGHVTGQLAPDWSVLCPECGQAVQLLPEQKDPSIIESQVELQTDLTVSFINEDGMEDAVEIKFPFTVSELLAALKERGIYPEEVSDGFNALGPDNVVHVAGDGIGYVTLTVDGKVLGEPVE